jgi:hypothetical protein
MQPPRLRADWQNVGPRFTTARQERRGTARRGRARGARGIAAATLMAQIPDLQIAWDGVLPIS